MTTQDIAKAGVALLNELKREPLFLANDKTLLLKPEIETIIAALELLVSVADGTHIIAPKPRQMKSVRAMIAAAGEKP